MSFNKGRMTAHLGTQPISYEVIQFKDKICPLPTHNSPLLISRNVPPLNPTDYLPIWPTDSCVFTDTETRVDDDDLIKQLNETEQQLPTYPVSFALEEIISQASVTDMSFVQRLTRSTFQDEIDTFQDPPDVFRLIETDAAPVLPDAINEVVFKIRSAQQAVDRPSGGNLVNYLTYLSELCPVCMRYCCEIHEYDEKDIFSGVSFQPFRDSKRRLISFPTPLYQSEMATDDCYSHADFSIMDGKTAKYHQQRISEWISRRKIDIIGYREIYGFYGQVAARLPKRHFGNLTVNYRQMPQNALLMRLLDRKRPIQLTRAQYELVPVFARAFDGNIPLLSCAFDTEYEEILAALVAQDTLNFMRPYRDVVFDDGRGRKPSVFWTDPFPGVQIDNLYQQSKFFRPKNYICTSGDIGAAENGCEAELGDMSGYLESDDPGILFSSDKETSSETAAEITVLPRFGAKRRSNVQFMAELPEIVLGAEMSAAQPFSCSEDRAEFSGWCAAAGIDFRKSQKQVPASDTRWYMRYLLSDQSDSVGQVQPPAADEDQKPKKLSALAKASPIVYRDQTTVQSDSDDKWQLSSDDSIFSQQGFEQLRSAFPYCTFAGFTPILHVNNVESELNVDFSISPASLMSYRKIFPIFSSSLAHQVFSKACYHPGLVCASPYCVCIDQKQACTYACGCYGQRCHRYWNGCGGAGGQWKADHLYLNVCYSEGRCCSPDDCQHYQLVGKQLQKYRIIRTHLPPTSIFSLRTSFPFKTILVSSPIHGFGVALAHPMKVIVGVPFLEYNGEIVGIAEAEKRGRVGDAYGLTYLFTLRVRNDVQSPELDAGIRGGLARYINHLEKSNTSTRMFSAQGESIVIILFSQAQVSGELTFNYGKQFKSDVADVKLKKVVK